MKPTNPPARATEEQRQEYAATPLEVRWLFAREPAELDDYRWLDNALDYNMERVRPMVQVPAWVGELTWVDVPTIECRPDKSPGFWRINANSREWYVTSQELANACR